MFDNKIKLRESAGVLCMYLMGFFHSVKKILKELAVCVDKTASGNLDQNFKTWYAKM